MKKNTSKNTKWALRNKNANKTAALLKLRRSNHACNV